MTPGTSEDHPSHIFESNNGTKLLRTSAIYGPNASGKSNLIKAISFLRNLVIDGTSKNDEIIPIYPFKLDEKYINSSSFFLLEFLEKDILYTYSVVLNINEVIEEKLQKKVDGQDNFVFHRYSNANKESLKDDSIVQFPPNNLTEEQIEFLSFLAESTRDNQLFLNELFGKNKKKISEFIDLFNVINWFVNSLKIFFPTTRSKLGLAIELSKDNSSLDLIYNTWIDKFDTGIERILLEKSSIDNIDIDKKRLDNILSTLPSSEGAVILSHNVDENLYLLKLNDKKEIEVFELVTNHYSDSSSAKISFDLSEESDGTKRILDFIPVLNDLSGPNNVILIDELERSLHPNISYHLISLFLKNAKSDIGSQLIFTTHEDRLLDFKLLRKDEIWFIEKNRKSGASSLYSLEEFSNEDIEKLVDIRESYLQGRFDAIPNL